MATSATSALTAKLLAKIRMWEGSGGGTFELAVRRNGSDVNQHNSTSTVVQGYSREGNNQYIVVCDDSQIIEYNLDRLSGTDTLNGGWINVAGYWEWE